MTPGQMRSLEEALKKFQIIKGGAGDGERTACETSLLNWLWGEDQWSDAFSCAHPLIRSAMITHNDGDSTEEQRINAVKLGVAGAIDTWWIPTEVVVGAMSGPRPDVRTQDQKLVDLLIKIAEWKENKTRANLAGANLAGANLTGANLTGAYLAGANLTGAYLADADLTRAYLTGANLTRANLTDAYLAGANLTRANLTRANLTRANLTGAYLTDADLTRAYLTRAYLTGATGLGATKNLNTITGQPYALPEGWQYSNNLIVPKP